MDHKTIYDTQARRAWVEITIAGKNVTTDLEPYLESFTFNDKTGLEFDDISIVLDNSSGIFSNKWLPERGDKIECTIITKSWDYDANGDLQDGEYYCGSFEIDDITISGVPSIVEIKAVSILNSTIRKELRSKTYEKITLKALLQEIANRHKLKLNYQIHDKDNKEEVIQIAKITQSEQSDIAFLAQLANDNNCFIKIFNGQLIICDLDDLEKQPPIEYLGIGDVISYKINTQAFDLYKDCKVSYFDHMTKSAKKAKVSHKNLMVINTWYNKPPKTRKGKKPKPAPKEGYQTYTYLDSANAQGGGRTLVIRSRVSNLKEAQAKAKAELKKHNKGEWSFDISMMGNIDVYAGCVIELVGGEDGFGKFGGWYVVDTVSHKLGGGFTTQIIGHRAMII